MRKCLFCGNEISGGHFCKSSGHHILYKKQLLTALANGTITEAEVEWLHFFNWYPGESNEVKTVKRGRKAKQVGKPVQFRKFGVELECVCPNNSESSVIDSVNQMGYYMEHTGYTHQDVPHWKSLYDSSVHGDYGYESKEYVSPAFDTEAGLQQVADVCKVIIDNGGKVNTTTGTHIHLDASDLSAQEIAKVVYLYGKLESKINQFMPESRKRNQYCGSVKRFCKYVSLSGFDYFNDVNKVIRVLGTRYLKVNVHAYLRHGTVEFRQLNGTLDGNTIKYWVKLCTRIVDFVKSGNDVLNLKGNIYNILGCEADEIEFWNSVKVSLAA